MRYEHKDMVRTRVTLQQSTSAVTFTVTLYIYECLLLTSISKVSFPYTSYSTLFDPIPPYLFIPYTLQSTLYTLRLYIPTFLHSSDPRVPQTEVAQRSFLWDSISLASSGQSYSIGVGGRYAEVPMPGPTTRTPIDFDTLPVR